MVRDYLAKGNKLKGKLKYIFKELIPKEVLQLTRATIKLQNKINKNRQLQKDEIQNRNKKELEEIERKNIPLKKCLKHGDLFLPDLIKSGKSRWTGGQLYKCRQCMRIFHKTHYLANREKILSAHDKYRQENTEKYREIKNKSKRKMYALNQKKYTKRSHDYDKLNPQKKIERQKRNKNTATKELKDVYVKQQLVRGTKLLFKDIPQDMVDTYKEVMKIKRAIKIMSDPVKDLKKNIRIRSYVKNKQHETIER